MGFKKKETSAIMDIHRMQEVIQIYDEKLDTPDHAHVLEMRWIYITSDWIKSLDESDRTLIFEYIGYILHQPGESPQKLRTLMMLAELPCPETEMLLDKMLIEGASMHTPFMMQYVHSNKMLCEEEITQKSTYCKIDSSPATNGNNI